MTRRTTALRRALKRRLKKRPRALWCFTGNDFKEVCVSYTNK